MCHRWYMDTGLLGIHHAYPPGMTSAKTATVRLYVTAVSVLTAVGALVGAVVRLLGASVALLAALVEKATPARAPKADARASETRDVAPLRLASPHPGAPARSVGATSPTAAEQLRSALVGMGWRPLEVVRVVGQLGPRVDLEPLQVLVPAALRLLAPAALTA
jgi:hypothetical protein